MNSASASLICAAISARLSSPAVMSIVTGVLVPGVKVLALQLPSSMVMLPLPMAVSAATAVDAVDWALASCCTVMVKALAGAPEAAVTPMAAALDDAAVTAFQPLLVDSLVAASPSAAICDLIVP